MNIPRAIILALILLEAVVTGILSETRVFPMLAAAAAIVLFIRPVHKEFSQRQKIYAVLAVTVFFAIKMRLFPLEITGRFSPFPGYYELNHALAQLFMVFQILLLGTNTFSRKHESRVFSAHYTVPFMGIATVALIADFTTQSTFYRITSMISAGLLAVFFIAYIIATSPRTTVSRHSYFRHAVCLALLSAAVASGIVMSLFAGPNVVQLDDFLFKFFKPPMTMQHTGISERSTLQSVSSMHNMDADSVAIRIVSETAPEYLRARVRDLFNGHVWESSSTPKPLKSVPPPEDMREHIINDKTYLLRPEGSNKKEVLTVWSALYQPDLIFTTLNTTVIAASPSSLSADEHYCCATEDLPRSRPYMLFTGSQSASDAPDESLRQRCLEIPASLTESAKEVCVKALDNTQSPSEKIQVTVQYFRNNYTYKLGIDIPKSQDALSYFLTERPPAHCEYFASGAVIMLRLAGVPCRYVTGFVVTEKNEAGGYWIARNRDAHAWAEAWDEKRGWVTVEATPPDGLPQSSETSAFAALRDMVKFRLGLIWALIREKGIYALSEIFRWLAIALTTTWIGRILLTIVLLASCAYALRKHPPRKSNIAQPPEEMAFQSLLARMDAQTRSHGFVREKQETLHQFADRIVAVGNGGQWHRVAGNWYKTCAILRCRGTSARTTLETLEISLEDCERATDYPIGTART